MLLRNILGILVVFAVLALTGFAMVSRQPEVVLLPLAIASAAAFKQIVSWFFPSPSVGFAVFPKFGREKAATRKHQGKGAAD